MRITTTVFAAVLALAAPHAQAAITGNALQPNALQPNAITFNAITFNSVTLNTITGNAITFNGSALNGATAAAPAARAYQPQPIAVLAVELADGTRLVASH